MSSNTNLKTLTVDGFMLTPLFDKDTLNYKVTVKSNTDALDLIALAENPNAKVEIFGNSDFKEGNNTIMIRVTDENGFSKIYQIDVEKPERSIFGMSIGEFLMLTFLGLGLLGLFLIIIALLKNRKEQEPATVTAAPSPTNIEFKPEFNFGSKNGTDDDIVYPNGVLNQGNGAIPSNEPKKLVGTYKDANYIEEDEEDGEEPVFLNDENAPFDYFDDTITKDELMAAIREGMETKNTDKLKMLMKQDELNQMKKEIKKREAKKRARSGRHYDE